MATKAQRLRRKRDGPEPKRKNTWSMAARPSVRPPTKTGRKHPKITPEIIDARVWYALRVVSQKEFTVQDVMQSKGIMTYVPVRKEWRHRNKFDRVKKIKTLKSYPETVGYVFAGFTPNQLVEQNIPNWLSIFEIPSVTGVVGTQGRPLRIVGDSLKELAAKHPNGLQRPNHEQYMRTHKEFEEGDTVVICSGPFQGHQVKVIEINEDKAKLPIEFLGETHIVEIECFDLERAVA